MADTEKNSAALQAATGSLEDGGGGVLEAAAVSVAAPASLNAAALREKRQRKKLRIKKLEKRLEVLDRHIKKCAEAEVSLDELESGFSAYIKEDHLKRKFVLTWQELCRLHHVSDTIAIEDREGAAYEGTPYPEVNRRIQRLLRLDEFPDYMDIVQLLDRCNTKHQLEIGSDERGQLARKIFKDVGRIMKRSRQRDFVHHFGSHLTDEFSSASDPAENDGSLLKLLQESMREGEKKMEAIVEKFVVRQEQECSGQQSQDGESSSATEEEEEEEEEEDKEREALLVEEVEKEVDLALDQDPQSSHKEEVVTCNLMEHKAVFADSTTVQSELSEVSSSHQKQNLGSVRECGMSDAGVTDSPPHISSSTEVLCLGDDPDVIILSDSDP